MVRKLRNYEPFLMTIHRFTDGVLAGGLFLVLSRGFGIYSNKYLEAGIFILFITMVSLGTIGLYQSWRTASLPFEIRHILFGCGMLYMTLLLVGYILEVSATFSRSVVLTWMATLPVLLGVQRAFIRLFLRYHRSKGRNIRRAVVVGAGELGARLCAWVDENPWSGTQIVGCFDDKVEEAVLGHRILGTLQSVREYVQDERIDTVYLTLPWRAEEKLRRLLRDLGDSTASIYLVPDIFFFDLILGGNVMYLDGLPAISLRDTPLRGVYSIFKRIEDMVLSSAILLVTSPLLLFVAVGVKLSSAGPVLFKQWRYGLNGRPILVYKFRTMTVCEDGYTFKQATKCDPRVTRFGGFLRRTSLDELPQFINVFQGRMSVVGPRPHPVALNEEFRKLVPGYMLRHKVKPGITGLAQVNGWRGETETIYKMQKRIDYDLEYLRQWSIVLDFKIILQTVMKSAWKTNAY